MSLTHTPELDAEFVEGIRAICEEHIVFNKVLGLKLTHLTGDSATARIEMRDDLVGHFQYNRLHGGVISAVLDAMGGIVCMNGIGVRYAEEPAPQRLQRFSKLGTIDLRIDYLRPSIGPHFFAHSELLRLGSRIGNTRMSFTGPDGKLLASGSGAYMVS
jgi:uncharacterized protein (TIGR00369 family)